jgi:hypothetical protein
MREDTPETIENIPLQEIMKILTYNVRKKAYDKFNFTENTDYRAMTD